MAVLLPRGAFLTEDRPIFTQETAEPLGVSPPKAVDSFLIEPTTPDKVSLPLRFQFVVTIANPCAEPTTFRRPRLIKTENSRACACTQARHLHGFFVCPSS